MKQRGKHGQSTGSVMRMCKIGRISLGKKEELKKVEETLPRLKECGLENVSRLYKAKTGVGCDGFHPVKKVEQSGSGRNKRARRCSS